MNAEKLAKFMHEEYEFQAEKIGWKTQKNCQVAFEHLPESNRKVMIKVAEKLLEKFKIAAQCAYTNWSDGHGIKLFLEDFQDFLNTPIKELISEFELDEKEVGKH